MEKYNTKMDIPKTNKNTANYTANCDQVKSSTVTESLLSSLKNLNIDSTISLLVAADYKGKRKFRKFLMIQI